jgi:hypothetical protein
MGPHVPIIAEGSERRPAGVGCGVVGNGGCMTLCLAAAPVVIVLAAAGCGGDDADDVAPTTTEQRSTSERENVELEVTTVDRGSRPSGRSPGIRTASS